MFPLETFFRLKPKVELNFTLTPIWGRGRITLETKPASSEDGEGHTITDDWNELLNSFGDEDPLSQVASEHGMRSDWFGFSGMLGLIIGLGYLYCQDMQEEEKNPCADPTIAYARKYGVKGLPIKDLPRYFKASKACEKMGGEALIAQIHINEYNRDYGQSKFMAGWTSTYGMCVTAIIFYFFVGLITVKK